jgi:lysophospholipase L1-like esterase
MARRLLALIGKFTATAILTVLLFAAIEFAAGFALLPREVVSAARSSDVDTVTSTLAWLWMNPTPLREDPEFLWRNEPLAKRTQYINPQAYASTAEWRIENDADGFRGSGIRNDAAAKDAYRVLCIGDSVTFGFNADQGDSYPAQLAGFLRARDSNRDIEVINAGVPGWTWLQGLRFLERRGLALEPDLVVMSHGVNDQFMRALVTDAERLDRADDPLVKWIAKARLHVAETNIYQVIEQQYDIEPPPTEPSPGCTEHISSDGTCKRVALEEIETAVGRASELTQSNEVGLIILNLDFMKTSAASAVKKAADRAGIPFVDHVHQMDFMRDSAQARLSDSLGLQKAEYRPPSTEGPNVGQAQVLFRLQTPDSSGTYSARGHAVFSEAEFEFNTPLNDEGLNGDEKRGDGVFSGTQVMPMGMVNHSYMFYRGEDPEFKSLPPLESAFADRSLLVYDRLIAPVLEFGERFMMAEQTHPNAEGYRMVAETVAFEIWKHPSFHRRKAPLTPGTTRMDR